MSDQKKPFGYIRHDPNQPPSQANVTAEKMMAREERVNVEREKTIEKLRQIPLLTTEYKPPSAKESVRAQDVEGRSFDVLPNQDYLVSRPTGFVKARFAGTGRVVEIGKQLTEHYLETDEMVRAAHPDAAEKRDKVYRLK